MRRWSGCRAWERILTHWLYSCALGYVCLSGSISTSWTQVPDHLRIMDILITSLLRTCHPGICPTLIQLPDGWRSNSYFVLSPWHLCHPRNGDISGNLLGEIVFQIQIYCISIYLTISKAPSCCNSFFPIKCKLWYHLSIRDWKWKSSSRWSLLLVGNSLWISLVFLSLPVSILRFLRHVASSFPFRGQPGGKKSNS
jgi:hypothetical protein